MRYPRKWQLAVVCLLALALIPFAPAPRGTAQAPGYTVTDLGTLDTSGSSPGEASRAFGLDECGRVVGESQAVAGAPASFRPFYWNGTTMTDLGTLGGPEGRAYAINQSGTVTGSALTSASQLNPFVRPTAGPMQNIGTLPGGNTAEAYDINASGQVVGVSEQGGLQDRAFIWQSGTGMQALTAPWGTPIRAFGINDAGQVAGTANDNVSGTHAFLTVGGVALDLGTLGGGVSVATEVNDSGEVSGYSYITIPPNTITQFFHAFRWKDVNGNGQSDSGEMIDLGVLDPGHKNSYAYDINNVGQVVGASETGTASNNISRAFIWEDLNSSGASEPGELQDLNTVVPGTGWTFQEARAINNRGQIVGTGLNPDGKVHAFLLTPTNVGPSPCDPTPTPMHGSLQFTISPIDASETQGTATITVNRTGGSDGPVSVDYATSDGTATTAGNDYTATSGTLNFADGDFVPKTFAIPLNNDTLDEPTETINLTLSNPGGGATLGAQNTAVLRITDNDNQYSINDVTVTEGNTGTTNATFTVTLSNANASFLSVNYTTADNTANAPGDYTTTSGTVVFNPGETAKTVTVPVVGDTLDEPNETFFVNLTSTNGSGIISDSQGVGTITDDDDPPTFQFSSATYSVGEGGGTATVTVTRTGGSNGGVSVSYGTAAGGSATAGSDYTATSGTLTFAAGDTFKTFTVTVNNDSLFEGDETVNLTLSSPTGGAALGTPSTATLTITDNDPPPVIQFGSSTSSYTVTENGVNITAVISVTRTVNNSGTESINYATSDGTAIAGTDYTAKSGTLTFGPGDGLLTFEVSVKEDTLDEPDETVNLTLSSPTGGAALGARSTATLTILDNDAPPTLQFDSATYTVGENGTTATVNVTRTGGSNGGVTVNYATSNGTATAGSDYTATNGTLTFAAGDNSETFTVAIANDTLNEINETVNLTLSSPGGGGALGAQSSATLTITDDDPVPSLSINDVNNFAELGGAATFTVTLSAASGKTVTVDYATADGTASSAHDYFETHGTLTFSPGQTSQNIMVWNVSDNFDEPDETFFVNLSGATNATISDAQGQGTIIDNDATPALFINDITITEGDSGTTNATFTVSLGPGSGQTVTVNYATSNVTAGAGSDYTATSGTLSFAPLEVTKTVTVQVSGDTVNEPNESFYVILSNPSHAFLLDAFGECFITNDDTPTLRFSQATYPVGESAHFVTVTVTRTGDPTPTVGVSFATSDGTATERRDYTAVSGRLQFAAGETSKTFDVLLTEDAYQESEETINLTLSNPTGLAVLGSQATATVNLAADDNPPPNFNPIDLSSEFVRQHYHDFLNREPDAPGLAFWTSEIENCGANAQCREVKRINVSAAFFLSIEFQETGYLVYRTYKAAYGDTTSPNVEGTVPVIRLNEFLPDTRRIGEGVIVNVGNWQQQLEANKNAYMAEFVHRPRFNAAYPISMTAAEFVDKLNQNAGGVLTQAERDQLVAQLSPNPAAESARAVVLRSVAENAALQQNEFRRAFVLMQFYGYMRRNPDDPQDTDFRGWKFWLDKLNQFNGNYVQAEMVKAFLDSIEYRTRFAP